MMKMIMITVMKGDESNIDENDKNKNNGDDHHDDGDTSCQKTKTADTSIFTVVLVPVLVLVLIPVLAPCLHR